jgi:hypothetical protein
VSNSGRSVDDLVGGLGPLEGWLSGAVGAEER